MFMPISKWQFTFAAALLLASCGKNNEDAIADAEKGAKASALEDGKIECALAGSAAFQQVCTTDRISGPDGQILTLRHPDGGFRRFKVLTDGRGLAPADGFDETKITLLENGMIEVSSGDDKYRLPAKIKPTEAPAVLAAPAAAN